MMRMAWMMEKDGGGSMRETRKTKLIWVVFTREGMEVHEGLNILVRNGESKSKTK
jgi:hypothetical protein